MALRYMAMWRQCGAVDHLKESEKIGARMSCGALANNGARGDLQRGVQTRQAVALVIVGLARRQSRSQRQHRLSAAEGLNLSFLTDAEDHGVSGRIHVQADNVIDFFFRLRIIAELECLDTVW